MTTLLIRPAALDQGTHEFISTFVAHVAAVAGYGENRIVTIARAKELLLAALAQQDGDSADPWRALYRTIVEIVAAYDARAARDSHAYLQSFIQENEDLADA